MFGFVVVCPPGLWHSAKRHREPSRIPKERRTTNAAVSGGGEGVHTGGLTWTDSGTNVGCPAEEDFLCLRFVCLASSARPTEAQEDVAADAEPVVPLIKQVWNGEGLQYMQAGGRAGGCVEVQAPIVWG